MVLSGGSMVPGYVQGGTRPPPDHPEGPLRGALYSCTLWISEALANRPPCAIILHEPGETLGLAERGRRPGSRCLGGLHPGVVADLDEHSSRRSAPIYQFRYEHLPKAPGRRAEAKADANAV